jgi:hypothetical protein
MTEEQSPGRRKTMSAFGFEELRPPLVAAAMAAAVDEPLDVDRIAIEEATSRAEIVERLAYLSATGLLLWGSPAIGRPLMLTRAGGQYLARRGRVSESGLCRKRSVLLASALGRSNHDHPHEPHESLEVWDCPEASLDECSQGPGLVRR